MTKLLDEAVARLRELPEQEQDAMAETLFAHLAGQHGRYRLSDEQVEEVKRRLAEPNPRFTNLEEVRARFRRSAE
jgi:putative addiction module component (TIGR02574 family)